MIKYTNHTDSEKILNLFIIHDTHFAKLDIGILVFIPNFVLYVLSDRCTQTSHQQMVGCERKREKQTHTKHK